MKTRLRSLGRKIFQTPNTIRYRLELRVLESMLDEHLKGTLGNSVLDAGAGSGEMGKLLLKKNKFSKLTGLEPFHIELLKENYKSVPSTEAREGSLCEMPFEDEVFDGVMSTQVFEHIEDDESAARELSRVLKTGGYALVSTPHPPEIYPNPDHVRPGYTEEEMLALFSPFGFELVATEYFFTLPTLERVIGILDYPFRGIYMPAWWVDCEKNLTNAQRKERQPYGIACLFKKSA